MPGVVLIAVNNDDIASTNQAKFLLKNHQWSECDDVESQPAFAIGNVRMWFLPERILWEDHLDRRWYDATKKQYVKSFFHQDMLP